MSTATITQDAADTRDIVRALMTCVEACAAGADGYAKAASTVRSPELAAVFRKYSQQRAAFVLALEKAIRRVGGVAEAPDEPRTSYLPLVQSHGDHAVLDGCAFGEQAALHAYEAADRAVAQTAVPDELRALVVRQYDAIRSAHVDLRARLARG